MKVDDIDGVDWIETIDYHTDLRSLRNNLANIESLAVLIIDRWNLRTSLLIGFCIGRGIAVVGYNFGWSEITTANFTNMESYKDFLGKLVTVYDGEITEIGNEGNDRDQSKGSVATLPMSIISE